MNLGGMRQSFSLENPGAPVPDGDGGTTQTWSALSPSEAWGSIERATQRSLERLVASTIASTATHIVTMRFHPDVTTQTRLSWTDRAGRAHTADVVDVNDVGGRGDTLILLVSEVVR